MASDPGAAPIRRWRLIRAFLNAGVMENGLVRGTDEGTPQGGPRSPLLSNLDSWIHRRLRCVQWKQWKRGRQRFAELRRLGVGQDLAAQTAGSKHGHSLPAAAGNGA